MADISKVILPDESEYDIKDITARSQASSATSTANSAMSLANAANNRASSAQSVASAASNQASNAYTLANSAVQTVNDISPDSNKNVETMISLTSAEYEAIPDSEKNSDNKLYLVTDESYTYPVDSTPTANSEHLVTSGGVYDSMEWKLAGTVTGTTPLTLPTSFRELHVNVTLASNYQVSENFIRGELNGGWYIWGAPYVFSGGIAAIQASAYITETTYTLYNARYDSDNKTSTAVSRVFYR